MPPENPSWVTVTCDPPLSYIAYIQTIVSLHDESWDLLLSVSAMAKTQPSSSYPVSAVLDRSWLRRSSQNTRKMVQSSIHCQSWEPSCDHGRESRSLGWLLCPLIKSCAQGCVTQCMNVAITKFKDFKGRKCSCICWLPFTRLVLKSYQSDRMQFVVCKIWGKPRLMDHKGKTLL